MTLTIGTDTDEHVAGLWQAVMAGDEYAARDAVGAALDAGLPAETVLLDVIGAVQKRVGVEWAAARINVAREHAATAINERVIAALTRHVRHPEIRYGRVTVACVDGEWHALPARLLAETLTLRGFAVDYLGAQVPTPHLIAHLHRAAPDAVALSSSIPTRRWPCTSPSTTSPISPTRSTRWSCARPRRWSRPSSTVSPAACRRCGTTPTGSASTRPRTSRTRATGLLAAGTRRLDEIIGRSA